MPPTHEWYGPIPGLLVYVTMIVISLTVFARRASFLVRLMMLGKPSVRWDQIGRRLKGVLVHVLGQGRLLTEFRAGLMHATIFWGFLILTVGTIEFFGKGFVDSFALPLISGQPYYLVPQDVFSIAVILAIGYAAFRRLVTK